MSFSVGVVASACNNTKGLLTQSAHACCLPRLRTHAVASIRSKPLISNAKEPDQWLVRVEQQSTPMGGGRHPRAPADCSR